MIVPPPDSTPLHPSYLCLHDHEDDSLLTVSQDLSSKMLAMASARSAFRRVPACRRHVSVFVKPSRTSLNSVLQVSEEVQEALHGATKKPVIALETAIYTHGQQETPSLWNSTHMPRLPVPGKCGSFLAPGKHCPHGRRRPCNRGHRRWCSSGRHGPRGTDQAFPISRKKGDAQDLPSRPGLRLRLPLPRPRPAIRRRHDHCRNHGPGSPGRHQGFCDGRSGRCPS